MRIGRLEITWNKPTSTPTQSGEWVGDYDLDDWGFRIKRAAEREVCITWPQVFCSRCDGRHLAQNECPYCKLQMQNNWSDGEFFDQMKAHKDSKPEVYDDPYTRQLVQEQVDAVFRAVTR